VCIKTKAKKSVTITITIAIILFSCNEWADEIHQKLLRVPHRHVVFTVPDKMRELLKNPKYQKVLFAASKITMEEMVASSNKISILNTFKN
jgi:hypothetical protein